MIKCTSLVHTILVLYYYCCCSTYLVTSPIIVDIKYLIVWYVMMLSVLQCSSSCLERKDNFCEKYNYYYYEY